MVSMVSYARDFAPFVPVFDPRKMEKPGIINGRNFLFDIDGPRSAFGTNFINFNKWTNPTKQNVQDFRVGTQIIYGTPTGLWWRNETSFVSELLLDLPVANTFWPWTYAKVGGLHYFAQYDRGLYQYNATTHAFKKVTIPTPYDNNVRGICESYGRLVMLTDAVTAWSALDDGTDLTPDPATGAGFQALGILSNVAYRVDPVSDGFITSTDRGWLKAEKVEAAYVFRHYVVSREVKLWTPNAGLSVPDIGIIALDANGFHISSGQKPEVWAPEMGEFLKANYLSTMKRNTGQIKLNYSEVYKGIFVGLSSTVEGTYEITFVYYIPSGKWGVYSAAHHGIFEVDIPPNDLPACGVMGTFGYMRYFTGLNQENEGLPTQPATLEDYIHWKFAEQTPVEVDTGAGKLVVGHTRFNWSEMWPGLFSSTAPTDLYEYFEGPYSDSVDYAIFDTTITVEASDGVFDGQTMFNFYPSGGTDFIPYLFTLPQDPLNAELEIGLFRFAEQVQADETSSITSLIIGTASSAFSESFEDWNTEAGDENWDTAAEITENWGDLSNRVPDNFDLELMSTDDGINAQLQGIEALEVAQDLSSALLYYPNDISAIYHRLKLKTPLPWQHFSLKMIDMTGMLTGRRL